MSLINDALKRAGQTPAKPPVARVGGGQPLRAAQYNQPSKAPIFVVLVMLVVLGAGGWFFWKWYQGKKNAPVAIAAEKPNAQETKSPSPAPANKETAAVVAPDKSSSKSADKTNALVISKQTIAKEKSEAKAAKLVQKQEEKASSGSKFTFFGGGGEKKSAATYGGKMPQLKLQGIFYNLKNPSAIINGKTAFIGTTISGARVTKIEADSVTVDWKGEEHLLELSQ